MGERRNLLLVGGLYHPAAENGPALVDILAGVGWRSEASEDVEGGLVRLAAGAFDQLTIACLRFTMTQHEKYAEHRARWALALSPQGRRAISDYLAAGNGLLALHTAPICFDDWPDWETRLGVRWRWGVSHHPPMAPLSARAVGAHPVVSGLEPFGVTDEIYSDLKAESWMTPILEARHADMARWRPVAFAGEHEGARRAWCGLGHDAASLSEPNHRRLIARAAQWVARDPVTA